MFYNFGTQPSKLSKQEQFVKHSVVRLFEREMTTEDITKVYLTKHYVSSELKNAFTGDRLKEINLSINRFTNYFVEEMYGNGLRTVAINYELDYVYGSRLHYKADYEALFAAPNNKIYPAYFAKSDEEPSKLNRARYNSVILADQSGLEVDSFFVFGLFYTGVRIFKYEVTDKDIKIVRAQMYQNFENMLTAVPIPNTNICKQCEFKNRCSLWIS